MADAVRWVFGQPWIFACAFGVALVWNGAYAVRRARQIRREGGTLLARVPDAPLFVERWTSGGSDFTGLSRIGGANNCLLVALTRDRLLVRPHAPFVFLPPSLDLFHDVAVADVIAVESDGRWVKVELPGRALTLSLRNSAGFLAAWSSIRAAARNAEASRGS